LASSGKGCWASLPRLNDAIMAIKDLTKSAVFVDILTIISGKAETP